ncbi:hypothetical protein [uncultured Deinococcus sp.]|uniref:hypothetical protein n=1 Tax=uncultured Deinococcus sp. TaxID=158789 RepID=UPI00258F1946|nr:hypothetical protein [uncultured Deinococcus sp.]
MRDPLMLLAIALSAALIFVVVSPSWTHQPADNNTLTVLGTMVGGLITAIATRKKDGDKDDDPPAPPPA